MTRVYFLQQVILSVAHIIFLVLLLLKIKMVNLKMVYEI